MKSQSKCHGCGNPTTYDSGFKQECATTGCVNFQAMDNPILPTEAIKRAELEFRKCGYDLVSASVDLCGDCAGMLISIDGDEYIIDDITRHCSGMAMVTMESGEEFYLADDAETAGEAAKEYWKEMVQHDPSEFACIVGESTLAAWAMGQSAGPGLNQVNSLDEWLKLWVDMPKEHFASYDGNECTISGKVGIEAVNELGFSPSVAYRQ